MRFLEHSVSQPWCILPERIDELVAVAQRATEATPEMLEAYHARALERAEQAGVRNGVAILNVDGPLFKRANLFVKFSGATSYEILRRDLQVALDDPKVRSILLIVDSPGGEASGCDELATAIYEARTKKPITAYVSGMAASGGYWIAAAASRIVVSDMAMLGSIGVALGLPDKKADEARTGRRTFEFVSSQSPGKRPDPATDEGRTRVQKMVDDLAAVFVEAVAKYRGVTTDAVLKRFGGGGMLIGRAAVKAGMADEVGQLEAVIASMRGGPVPNRSGPNVSAPPAPVDVTAPIAPKVLVDEAAKIRAVLQSENGQAMPALAGVLALDLNLPLATCEAVLKAGRRSYEAAKAKAETPKMDYAEYKRGRGTLGVDDMPSSGPDHHAGWSSAVASANGARATT
jgi:signal peptide peptidase SppA